MIFYYKKMRLEVFICMYMYMYFVDVDIVDIVDVGFVGVELKTVIYLKDFN